MTTWKRENWPYIFFLFFFSTLHNYCIWLYRLVAKKQGTFSRVGYSIKDWTYLLPVHQIKSLRIWNLSLLLTLNVSILFWFLLFPPKNLFTKTFANLFEKLIWKTRVYFTLSTFCKIWNLSIFTTISILNFLKSSSRQTFIKTKII